MIRGYSEQERGARVAFMQVDVVRAWRARVRLRRAPPPGAPATISLELELVV